MTQLSVPGCGPLNVHEPYVRRFVHRTPDWPQPTVDFLDLSPLLADARAFRLCVDSLVARYADLRLSHVAGIDARGFTVGSACTLSLLCPCVLSIAVL